MQLTESAARRLEQYIAAVRNHARSFRADPDDVEEAVREHLDAELAATGSPATERELDLLLDRLGDPASWSEAAGDSAASRHDWPLAVASAATTAAGVSLAMLFDVPPLLVLVGFVLARIALARAQASDLDLGVRKWLVYPSVALVYGLLVVLVVVGPLFPINELAGQVVDSGNGTSALQAGIVVTGMATWLGCLLLLATRAAAVTRSVFVPFLSDVGRTPLRAAGRCSLALATLCGVGTVALLLVGQA